MKKKNYIKPQVRLFPVRIHVMVGSPETPQDETDYNGPICSDEEDNNYRQAGIIDFIEDDEY